MKNNYRVREISIKLENENRNLSQQWFLIKGRLKIRDEYLKAKIVFKDGVGLKEESLPVSCKGTLLELIKIPSQTKEIKLKFISPTDNFEIVENFSIRPVNEIERIYRMFRRVIFFFKKRFKQERKILGLSWYTLFFKLQKAYKLSNKIRDCYSALDYKEWIEKFDVLQAKDIEAINQDIEKSKINTKFHILVIENGNPEDLKVTINSLKSQLYKNFTFHVISKTLCPNLDSLFKSAQSEDSFFITMHAGTTLSVHALYWIAKEAEISGADFIYTDHDYIDSENIRTNPYFKPDFSLEYLRSFNYIDFSFAAKAKLLSKVELVEKEDLLSYDSHSLVFKLIEKTDYSKIKHIPAILFHIPEKILDEKNKQINPSNPVKAHLDRLRISARVDTIEPYRYRVIYTPKTNPLISIIIPTKDHLQILRKCIESILKKTTYENFEIIVVDNNSTDKDVIEYLNSLSKNPKIRVLKYREPFNFSAINNFAVEFASGEVIVFLNNDTEVITPKWLEIMLGCLEQPQVGAVGVKLYYRDDTIQHAGVVIGLSGCAGHVFKGLKKGERGYMDRAILQQEYSAVTAACMMTRKELFKIHGGFDEINLPVGFNDTDYCLRLRESGYRIIFTPFVELYHHESASRSVKTHREANYMRKRWSKYMGNDPFYNPNLSYKLPGYRISNIPRVKKPWE